MNIHIINELKEMMKEGKGYLTVKHFIKDFEIDSAKISNIDILSEYWTLSIKIKGRFIYLRGFNFGW